MNDKILGILGGLGPLATVYFMDMVAKMTEAQADQDHISMIVLNHAAIPDRTEFILDNTKPNPLPMMVEDAKKLEMVHEMRVFAMSILHYALFAILLFSVK